MVRGARRGQGARGRGRSGHCSEVIDEIVFPEGFAVGRVRSWRAMQLADEG
jgi:hypothetical protein